MKSFILIFLLFWTFCGCANVQTQQVLENKLPLTVSSVNNNSEEIGYQKFTNSDKQYIGCWRSVEVSEVVEYELKFFYLTENEIQTSKMSKSIAFKVAESNSYKDYFVLQTESKNKELQPFLSINMISNDEMTLHEFSTKENISNDGEGLNYWNLKREDCNTILKNFKNR